MFKIREPSYRRSLALALFFGLVFTLAGYDYGLNNHIEQLPIVLRFLDAGFLSNDFFVNASAANGPRWFFSLFVAFFARQLTLEGVYFILTLAANMSTAAVTFFAGRALFGNMNLAGVLGAGMVMAGPIFDLGGSTSLVARSLVPSILAMPLVLLAVWSAFQQKPWWCVLFAGLASLFHPLLGLEAGALGLFAVFAAQLLGPDPGPWSSRWKNKKLITALVLLGIWIIFALAFAWSQPRIDSSQFLDILAFFRHPHHYLPSTFGLANYAAAASFLAAAIACIGWWRRIARPSRPVEISMITFLGTILLVCLGGYVFVEVFPTRIWTTIQAFRLFALVKWTGILMISGVIADLLRTGDGLAYPFLIASLSPYALAFTALASSLRTRAQEHLPALGVLTHPLPVMLAALFLLASTLNFESLLLAVGFYLGVLLLIYWPGRLYYGALAVGVVSLLLVSVFRAKVEDVPVLSRFLPQFTLAEISGNEQDIARYALANTPENSIILTPPELGEFRIFAQRAILVDFKAFPFQEPAMLEWRKRILEIYGETRATGFAALEEMEENYQQMDDRRIQALQKKYGIGYAVVYAASPSQFPVLYENEEYKLVRLPGSTASPRSR